MHGWSHKSVRETKTSKNPNNPSFSSTLLDEIYRSMDYAGEDKLSSKQSVVNGGGGSGRSRSSNAVEDEGIATLRRPFLVQKWIDMKINTKNFTDRRMASSMRDNDDPFFYNNSISRSHKPSCFRRFRSKPIKTEHPISPGSRITAFLNSFFTNVHLKKPKDLKPVKIERTSKPTHDQYQSTCSSASSYTRSCLSKNSPRSREKINNGVRRTVRFYPVSVIIDEDCRPCGEKFICCESDIAKVNVTTLCGNTFDDDDDNNDIGSDVSSDLFELDHLSILKECDELPV